MGVTVTYLSLLVLIPLAGLVWRTAGMDAAALTRAVMSPRALAAYRLSFGGALIAGGINVVFGMILAWVLVRYDFPGRTIVDAAIDLPFALPTAVAGIALTTLYVEQGWIGRFLEPHGIKVAFAPAGVVVAMVFVGVPFVVRTVQPVLLDLDLHMEEVAATLGASRLYTLRRVIFPAVLPAALTGFALAFARAVGEYGSIVFISGNMPGKTEIAPLLIVTKLEQFDYHGRDGDRAGHAAGVVRGAVRDQRASGEDPREGRAMKDPRLLRWLLLGLAFAFLALFVGLPIVAVFVEAFRKGASAYWEAIRDPETISAIKLTLITAAISVPMNLVFGIAAAWLIAKYRFPGKKALLTLIDLPFSVSPVIAGLIFVLLLGARGVFGPFLEAHDIHIIFAVPGIVLATTFITFPFVAREVLPIMQDLGSDEEEQALTLGANGWQILFRVTLPKVRWGILYGVILCNARAMGEFGAVSVVSGHIRGQTNTIPLQVEILYNEYNLSGAFAVASLLTVLALLTLLGKKLIESRIRVRA